ncbi:hypothetical protein [Spartinivicinus poritis]|uniref:Apolipoprotein B n=1 Tax=Spartinivicinus poritis TaxID=2994640 RepID=A0ABT5UD57_9GAMM|nr:hypothetical protein [Spartinivicinus sp. A2-2]MDE1463004.1 hypothetical protein [Spartinivicinus sp. A2-2]
MTTLNSISVTNKLSKEIIIYDAYYKNEKDNYKKGLTKLGVVAANSTSHITPLRSATLFVATLSDSDIPVYVKEWLALGSITPLIVTQQSQSALANSLDFIKFAATHSTANTIKQFNALWKNENSNDLINSVNNYFKNTKHYRNCCFLSYNLAMRYHTYILTKLDDSHSLKALIENMGGDWPVGFPDVQVSHVNVQTKNGTLDIWVKLDMNLLAQQLPAASNLNTITKESSLLFNIDINPMAINLNSYFDTLSIPAGGRSTLEIKKPKVKLSINPLFQFIVFEVIGDIFFNVFGQPLSATVSMVIDNIEANVAVNIKSPHQSLLTPPGIKGLHLDEFGMEIGVFFKPTGLDLGISGRFHLGESNTKLTDIKDNQFGLVFSIVEEVPEPAYLSYYLSQISLEELLILFTNTRSNIPFPISFKNLSFYWSQEPIALPDGTLSHIGLSFSSAADILGFKYYGQFNLDLNRGIEANIQAEPILLGNIFHLYGDGKGVNIRVDGQGNPIKNNQLKSDKVVCKTKNLVPSGGLVMTMSTSSSPYFHIKAKLSFLELIDYEIDATIDHRGINFELDFSSLIKNKMSCVLNSYRHFHSQFTYGIDSVIPLPNLCSFHMGHLHLKADVNATLILNIQNNQLIVSASAEFTFQNMDFTVPVFELKSTPHELSDIIKAFEQKIISDAKSIFEKLLNNASQWAHWVEAGLIDSVSNIACGLKSGYQFSAKLTTPILKDIGYNASKTAKAMINASYSIDSISSSLSQDYNLTNSQLANSLNDAGVEINSIAEGLKSTGASASQVASTLKNTLKLNNNTVKAALQSAQYPINEVNQGLKSIGDVTKKVENEVLHHLNPFHW